MIAPGTIPPPPPGFVPVTQEPPAPTMPHPFAVQAAPPPPPSGYRPVGENLAPIPGGPADPARTPPSGYRFTAGGALEAIPGGPADPERNNHGPSGNASLTGPEYLATIPDVSRRAQVQAMIDGRIPYPTGRALTDAHWQQIVSDAIQADPAFDAATSARRRAAITQFTGNGRAAQTVASANRIAHHLEDLNRASERLAGPESGFSPLDTVMATAGQLFERPDAATYDNAVGAVANELERYFRQAGGSEADIARAISNLGRNQSLPARRAAIREVISLIHGGMGPMQNQYNDAFQAGTSRPRITWVDRDAQRVYRDLGGQDFTLAGQDDQQQAAPVASDHHGDAVVFGMDRQPPPTPSDPGNVPGGPEFAGALQEAIRSGRFRNAAEAMAFAQSLNPELARMVNQRDLIAAVRNPRLAGVLVPRNPTPPPPPPPDISAERGANADPNRLLLENAMANANPVFGPISQTAQSVLGPESANALNRGLEDFPTMGFGGEIRSSINAATGNGTYQDNLAHQNALDDFDYENHFGPRLGGQIIGGLPFAPLGGETLGARVGIGAAEGGAYGFGSGRDGFQNRAENAFIGAGVGAGTPLVLSGAGRAVNALVGRSRAGNEVLAAGERLQIPVTRLEAGGTGSRMAAGVVGMTPGEIPLVTGTRASAAGSQAARNRIAGTIGVVRDETGAGSAGQRGIRDWRVSSADRRTQLFNRVPIPAERPAATSATASALRERTAGMESNQPLSEMFRDNRLEGYLAAIEGREAQVPTGVLGADGQPLTRTVQQGGGLSYGDMRRFRSLVGEMIEQPNVAGESSSKAALRALYGGLSRDLEATAQQTSPRALTLMRRAVQYDRGRHARLDGLVTDILGRENSENPLAAYEQINRWARAKGGDPNRLGQALRSMPADEANSVRATVFARMGQASAGKQDAATEAFSPAEFATQWNKLSERARGFLVPNAEHRAALNDLVTVTTAQKRSSQYANFSRTALGANAVAFFEAMRYAPVTAITTALGSLGAGKFLGSPPGARWLRTVMTARNPRLAAQALRTVAQRDPAIAQEALGLRQYLLSVANDNAATTGRAAASPDGGPNEQQ